MLVRKQSKKISNDQELIQSDLTSCPQNQKGNNYIYLKPKETLHFLSHNISIPGMI